MNSPAMGAEWARDAFDNPKSLTAKTKAAPHRHVDPPSVLWGDDDVPARHIDAPVPGLATTRPPRPAQAAPRPPEGGTHADANRLLGVRPKPTKAATAYRILSPADMLASPVIRDLVHGVLPPSGLAGIVGASMAGKGFIVFDLMAVFAVGGYWFDRRVVKVPVIYVCLEGAGGLHKRIRAWERKNGRKYPDIGIITESFDLRDSAHVAALIAAIRAAGYADGVVVIDTLNQASPGTDENSSRDMGELIAGVQEIQAALGGLVLVVHHLGKDTSRGPRGHSSFLAALDACIEVRRDGDRRSWIVAKAKDDADGEEHQFRLEVIEVGEDEDGDIITSCVVEPCDDAKTATSSRLPKGGNQRIVWNALGELLRESVHFGKNGAPATRPCIELEPAVGEIAPRLAVDSSRQTERTRQAITGLVASGLIELRGGWLWSA